MRVNMLTKLFGSFLAVGYAEYGLASGPADHCLTQEQVFFSCIASNKKIISLCGRNSKEEKYLFYRFGRANKIELEFPKKAVRSLERFSYNHYFRYGVDYYRVAFSNDGYDYSVFRSLDATINSEAIAGVLVGVGKAGEKGEVAIQCAESIVDNLNDLSGFITCNRESALGCAN